MSTSMTQCSPNLPPDTVERLAKDWNFKARAGPETVTCIPRRPLLVTDDAGPARIYRPAAADVRYSVTEVAITASCRDACCR
jgi:hypothetical protein